MPLNKETETERKDVTSKTHKCLVKVFLSEIIWWLQVQS